MRIGMSILGLAVLAGAHMTDASAQAPTIADGCYARDYAKGDDAEDYSWIRIVVKQPSDGLVWVSLKYAHTSLPDADFGGDNSGCWRDGASVLCQVMCDGGRLRLRPIGNGDLLVETTSYAVDEGRMSSLFPLLSSKEADLFIFSGTHVLRRVPMEQCTLDKTAAEDTRVLLQPGDYHPKVAIINRQLAKLGFLSAPPPDFLYSKETAAAMSAFQKSMGYPPTGTADVRSMRMLNVHAVTKGGC